MNLKDLAYKELSRLNKSILFLEKFGLEDCVNNYLLKYKSKTKEQAMRSKQYKEILEQIKVLKAKVLRLEIFIDELNHIEYKLKVYENEGENLNIPVINVY